MSEEVCVCGEPRNSIAHTSMHADSHDYIQAGKRHDGGVAALTARAEAAEADNARLTARVVALQASHDRLRLELGRFHSTEPCGVAKCRADDALAAAEPLVAKGAALEPGK